MIKVISEYVLNENDYNYFMVRKNEKYKK
ncbi:hypothetical protein GTPV_gp007 [Goatpox virus Pellor]|uniref:Uncharacterized protein n=1 Tax=Goatpox virus TaxID=186805 RepID=A0A1B2LPI2_9POXV|nr:hypothetical protein GTPV_gp007 [Goatpox virus Pellor]AOA32968.1 hypothetical protein GTPV_gp007 [Goatpox virus]